MQYVVVLRRFSMPSATIHNRPYVEYSSYFCVELQYVGVNAVRSRTTSFFHAVSNDSQQTLRRTLTTTTRERFIYLFICLFVCLFLFIYLFIYFPVKVICRRTCTGTKWRIKIQSDREL